MAHVLAMMAGVNARCAGKSVGGDGAAWSAVSPHLPTPSSHPVCSCVALQQAVSYASIYKAKGRHQLIQRRACSRLDQGSPLGQPGRACSRVVATVMPCTRALCVRAGPVGAMARCAEAAVGEFVGRREGVLWGLGALCARNPCYTRPPRPWLAMQRLCGASEERGSDSIIW